MRQYFDENQDKPYHIYAEDGKTIVKTLNLDGTERAATVKKSTSRKLPELKGVIPGSRLPKLSSRMTTPLFNPLTSSDTLPYSKKPQFVDYQPYTLKDAETFKPPQKLGGLGANLDTEEYLLKVTIRKNQQHNNI